MIAPTVVRTRSGMGRWVMTWRMRSVFQPASIIAVITRPRSVRTFPVSRRSGRRAPMSSSSRIPGCIASARGPGDGDAAGSGCCFAAGLVVSLRWHGRRGLVFCFVVFSLMVFLVRWSADVGSSTGGKPDIGCDLQIR
ncbi:hypothetical protein DN051_38910 [Streptomyces cadmiisoli]|uniref:Uncharacterized protein n=1 Tax=Streptomyces cadmiisoli TaxID=2184053 RepID=A0A2Z4JAA0_9ACTN|nr:hypothetical protein DN051_38910 [Streptomyces cadmiisoli]